MRTFDLFFVFIVFLWVVAALHLLFWRSHEGSTIRTGPHVWQGR